jgi:hypothetical protein
LLICVSAGFASEPSIFEKIGDPRSQQAVEQLLRLRADWDGEEFDKAWKEKTGEDVPEEIIKGSEGEGGAA